MEIAPATPRPPAPRPGRRRARGRAALLLFAGLAGLALAPAPVTAEDAAGGARVLRVATTGDYPPFSMRRPGGADPAFEGFDIDVATRFAADLGYRVEFVPFRWPDLSRELAAGSFDIAMSGVTQRTDRSLAGRFTVPVAATHALAISWKGSGIATLEALDRPQRRVAVNAGGHLEKVAESRLRRAHVVALADNAAVHMAMLDRAFDAVVTEDIEAARWSEAALDVVRLGPLSDDRKSYLLPADHADLAMELDLWLLAREKDGTLGELRTRHFAGAGTGDRAPGTQPAAEPFAALASAIVERLALMPLVYGAKKRSGAPIEDPAREDAVLETAVAAVDRAAELSARPGLAAPRPAEPRPAPDAGQVRFLFRALMSAGKDVQKRIADADEKRRPGTVVQRTGADPSGADAASDAAREAQRELRESIRPAIGRITDRIACILVAMDEKVSVADASQRLHHLLSRHGIDSNRIDAIASALARISSRRPDR